MSPKDRDEEKDPLEPYHDNGQQLDTSDEPPLYRTEGQFQDTNVDPSAEREARKKNCLRKMGRHLAIFAALFFVWQTFLRRPKTMVCRWPPLPGSEPLLDVLVRSTNSPGPLSYDLKTSSDALGLFARGPWSIGHLNVEQGSEDTDTVLINVTTRWSGSGQLLNHIELCKFTAGEKERVGVGIVSKKGHPTRNRQFRHLDACVFSQTFGHLGRVHFDAIGIFGSDAALTVESLSARNTTTVATMGSITGSFSTSSSLKLVTASGNIDVNVELSNDDKSGNWTHLDIQTAVPAIKANVSMYTAPSTQGGKFNITSGFKSGSANLNTLIGPPKSTVDLGVAGGVGPLDVAMHKSFEGKFYAVSSPVSYTTVVAPKEEEKEEDGKERKIDFERAGKVATGSVWWDAGDGDDGGKERGSVRLASSLGDVILKL
ncbi:hypothetical protein PQX77_015594 [Marasmius sp. AFHP31]|nr:hypothetical protein PQX77_015594 [Marasmius sp. AFHP31]